MALLTTCFVKFFSCEILEIQAAKPVFQKKTLMLAPEILQLLCCLRLLNHSPKEISIGNLQGNFPNATLCLSKALLRDHGCYFLTNRRFFSGKFGRLGTLQFLSSDLVTLSPRPGYQSRHQKGCLADFLHQHLMTSLNVLRRSHKKPSWQLRYLRNLRRKIIYNLPGKEKYPLTKRNF